MLKEMFKFVWNYELSDKQINDLWDIKQYEKSFYLQEKLAKKLKIKGNREDRIKLFIKYVSNTNL